MCCSNLLLYCYCQLYSFFFFAGGRSSPAAPAVLIAFFQSRGGGPAFGKAVLMEDDLRGEPSAPNEAGGAKSGYGQTGQG